MDGNFVFITGMSGAGKSIRARALEDVGFYCIDNLPSRLIPKLIEVGGNTSLKDRNVACVVDIRTDGNFEKFLNVVQSLKSSIGVKMLFLDAKNDVLLTRYKETRRVHPVMLKYDLTLVDAIQREREMLKPVLMAADYVVDTSLLSTSQLKEKVLDCFVSNSKQNMGIEIVSFGYKYGLPTDADLVFDVRCLKNPFYVPSLKKLTGEDIRVRDYIFGDINTSKLIEAQQQLLRLSIPLYIKEGKAHLTICFGCTGGRHRSVTLAIENYKYLRELGYYCSLHHRDIQRSK
jgi:UPF0042 nucleotide-binding protein